MTTTTISLAEVPAIQARLRGWIQALRECETEITRLKAAGVPTGGILADLVPLTLGLALGLQLLDEKLGENAEWTEPRSRARAWSSSRPPIPSQYEVSRADRP
jgi:hypothetical protein